MKLLVSAVALATALAAAAPAVAAPVLVRTDANFSTTPFTFSIQGVSFTFGGSGDRFAPLNVSNGPGGAISSFLGRPTSFFTNRGNGVTFGPNEFGAFTSFASPTNVRFSNGENFLGLRATVGGQNFFGFAFTTNSVLNGFGFETTANTAITATTQIAAAVPEPATWGLMLVGFAMVGAGVRYRRRSVSANYA